MKGSIAEAKDLSLFFESFVKPKGDIHAHHV